MLAGHFSTALIAHQKFPKGSLLYFLIASQFQDLLWLTFHYLGLEPTGPSDVLGATLINMTVDMVYSHDLLPQIFWIIVIFGVGKLLFKDTKVGLVGSGLVLGHFILDFFSGHPHHFFGADSQTVGLGLYASNVYLAIAIEVIFTITTLSYFLIGEAKLGIQRSSKSKILIIGLFVFGIAFMLSIATTSFRVWFNIPEINLPFNTNVPMLIMTYVFMILYLNYFVPKYQKNRT